MATTVKRKTKPKIEIDLVKVESLAAVGCTIEEIAASLGITDRTIYRRMQEEKSGVSEAITRGRMKGITTIENALFKAAQEDWRAASFWLCNRANDKWQSMNKIEMTGKNGAPIQPPVFNIVAHSDKSDIS